MLSVKSNVLKSSNNPYFPTLVWLLFSFLMAVSPFSFAQDSAPGTSLSAWLSVGFSLLLVIAVILLLAFIMRRFSGVQSSGGQIKTVASMMVGTRERIAVIQVGDEQHLVGVTSHNINHLAKLETPISAIRKEESLKQTFAGFLQQQKKLQGETNDKNT